MSGKIWRAVLLCLCLLMLGGCAAPVRTDAALSRFSFSHSGMHTGRIFSLAAERTVDGWQAQLDLFCGQQVLTLPMAPEEAGKLEELIDSCNLWAWNGFKKADRRMLDGEGFDLYVSFADGQKLRASGSNAFPKSYAAAESAIKDFFIQLMEKNGFENSF